MLVHQCMSFRVQKLNFGLSCTGMNFGQEFELEPSSSKHDGYFLKHKAGTGDVFDCHAN